MMKRLFSCKKFVLFIFLAFFENCCTHSPTQKEESPFSPDPTKTSTDMKPEYYSKNRGLYGDPSFYHRF